MANANDDCFTARLYTLPRQCRSFQNTTTFQSAPALSIPSERTSVPILALSLLRSSSSGFSSWKNSLEHHGSSQKQAACPRLTVQPAVGRVPSWLLTHPHPGCIPELCSVALAHALREKQAYLHFRISRDLQACRFIFMHSYLTESLLRA